MQNFFRHEIVTSWAQPRDSLHVYALPDPALRAALAPFQRVVAGFPACGVQPPEFLHATVSRLPAFRTDLSAAQLEALSAAITAAVRTIAPFTVELARPEADENSASVGGVAGPPWQALVDGVRAAATEVLDGELPQPPHRPHVSLGYGVGDGSTAQLRRLLDAVPDPGPLLLHVDAVHLLAVHQNPDAGTFTWDPIDVRPLARPA